MPRIRVHGLAIVAVALVLIQVASTEAGASVIYDYRGNEFVLCGYGCPGSGPEPDAAPANWDEDFLIASLTFDAPLAPNLTFADDVRAGLLAYTITDKLGTFFESGTELPDFEEDGETIPGLQLATDAAGNLLSWIMAVDGVTTQAGMANPPFECEECGEGVFIADFAAVNIHGGGDEWDAFNDTPGQWRLRAVPEPATLALSLIALGGFAIRRRR
jgi:hypothetical protein